MIFHTNAIFLSSFFYSCLKCLDKVSIYPVLLFYGNYLPSSLSRRLMRTLQSMGIHLQLPDFLGGLLVQCIFPGTGELIY